MPIKLGHILSVPKTDDVWANARDTAANRGIARQTFGLTEEQSRHPTLCFEEFGQIPRLTSILLAIFAPQIERRLLIVWLYEENHDAE